MQLDLYQHSSGDGPVVAVFIRTHPPSSVEAGFGPLKLACTLDQSVGVDDSIDWFSVWCSIEANGYALLPADACDQLEGRQKKRH